LKLWNSKCEVLIAFAPFIFVMVAFVAFIIWNGGIVLGRFYLSLVLLLSDSKRFSCLFCNRLNIAKTTPLL
jgi:hypothetical protein